MEPLAHRQGDRSVASGAKGKEALPFPYGSALPRRSAGRIGRGSGVAR